MHEKELYFTTDPSSSMVFVLNGQAIVTIHDNGVVEVSDTLTPADRLAEEFLVALREQVRLANLSITGQ